VVQGSYVKNCLHLEKLRVLELSDQYKIGNPICCDKSMKSLGRDKGYKCLKCKAVKHVRLRDQISIKREVAPGAYEVTPSARRHLAEPLVRSHNLGYAVFPSR